jgi:hypothetical protein
MGWDNSASEKVLGRSVMVFFFWGIHEKSMGNADLIWENPWEIDLSMEILM